MENAPQQVVAKSGDVPGRYQRCLRRFPDGGSKSRILGAGEQGRPSGLKNGFIVQSQDQVPSIAERPHRVGCLSALLGHSRRPDSGKRLRGRKAVVKLRAQVVAMAVQTGMEHNGGCYHQQSAFGRGIPGMGCRPLVFGLRRQVNGPGQFLFLAFAQPAYCPIQAAGKRRRHIIRVAQLRRGQADNRRQPLNVALDPIDRRTAIPNRPNYLGRRQGLLGGVVRVAHRDGALRQTLRQAGIRIADSATPLGLVLPMLRLYRNHRRANADFHINPQVSGINDLGPGVQPQPAQHCG